MSGRLGYVNQKLGINVKTMIETSVLDRSSREVKKKHKKKDLGVQGSVVF